MKRILAFLITVALLAGVIAVPGVFAADGIVASGTCGEMLTWTLDDNGKLTISGTGDMYDYGNGNYAPWLGRWKSIKSIVIEDGVTSIGKNAFRYYHHTSVYYQADNYQFTRVTLADSITKIGSGAFARCESLGNIKLPEELVTIESEAFAGCARMTKIVIPSKVSSISPSALPRYFSGYVSSHSSYLTTYEVAEDNPYYSTDDRGVLYNKEKTTLTSCPASLEDINSFVIPDSVESIGAYAFRCCESLTGIAIPNGVTSIGDSAFEGCKNLRRITLPNGVTSIGGSAFEGCKNLRRITIPNGVTSIGSSTFDGCKYLTSITIPNGVTSIKPHTFDDCTGLSCITIPVSLKTINFSAFRGCDALNTVYYEGSRSQWDQITIESDNDCLLAANIICSMEDTTGQCGDNLWWELDENGILEITGTGDMYDYADGESPFANRTDIYEVLIDADRIGTNAFQGCSRLINVTLEVTIKSIGQAAFSGCQALDYVFYNADYNQWLDVSVAEQNEPLLNAERQYKTIKISGSNFTGNLDNMICDIWPSSTYNTDLANMLCALSSAAYSKSKIKTAYDALGFDYCGPYDYLDKDDSSHPDYCGYSLGFRKLPLDDATVCLVTVRGSFSDSDWIGNINIVPTNGKHSGFEQPAQRIYRKIQEETEARNITGKIKYVITGHSRGAAVANLLAVKLMDNGIPASDVYDYNFACPDVACKIIFKSYDNIYNLCNRYDVVPLLPGNLASCLCSPGSSWGKFGKTFWFSKKNEGNVIDWHAIELYLEFFNQRLHPQEWPTSFEDTFDDFFHNVNGYVAKILCPVDVTITDTDGNPIASVTGGKIDYHNSMVGDVIILTDGDRKVIYINREIAFNVNLTGTDDGEMTYSIGEYCLQTGEYIEEKTFSDVKLKNGKYMYSPVSEAKTTSEVQLFVAENNNDEIIATRIINTDGSEEAIYDPTEPSTEQQAGLCKYCKQVHNGFIGKIIGFFHAIAYFFAHLFGKM